MCAPEITLWDKVPSPGALFFLFFSPLPLPPSPCLSFDTGSHYVVQTGWPQGLGSHVCATIPICNFSFHPRCARYMTQAGLKFAFSCFSLLGTEITYGWVVMGYFALLLVPNHAGDIHLGGTPAQPDPGRLPRLPAKSKNNGSRALCLSDLTMYQDPS